MPHDRRRFFGLLGGASLAGVVGVPAMPGVLRAQADAGADFPRPITDKWDVSWADRVNGLHRAVFDSPDVSEGAALVRAVAWCDHYKEVYGVERKDMSAVVVMRHHGIDLAMNDAYWERFRIGKEHKIKQDGKWAAVNPISAASSARPDAPEAYTIESFLANGGIVLACAWAFGRVVERFKTKDKLDKAAAGAKAREHLLPGVLLQPNGIFAVLRAQEAGCQYVIAS